MTDDFDVSLRRRLEAVASAVPVVPPGDVAAVVRQPVRARSTSRLALAGVLPVLAVVAVGAVLASVAQIGPGPGDSSAGSSNEANRPISATSRSGNFELTIRSARTRYAVDEPIEIEAALTYVGDELPGGVQIGHALGADDGPLGFGIEEPVIGELRLAPGRRDACARTVLVPGEPLSTAFAKSAGWSGDDPRSDDYRAFVLDPVLRLSAGTWHVYVVASFSVGDCGPDSIEMRADLMIEVDAQAATQTPTARPPDQTGIGPLTAIDDDGTFRLELRSSKSVYVAGEPIDIEATLAYIGSDQTGDFEGGILLSGTQTDGTHWFAPGPRVMMCVPRELRDLPDQRELADWPKVRSLPAGAWRILASFSGSSPACTRGGSSLTASIDVTIVDADEPARTIPLLTAADVDEVSSDRFCRNDTPYGSGGELALNATSGLGLASENGDIQPIRWPPGFTAEILPDGAILYAEGGQIAGREGDPISFPAGIASDGVLSVCGHVLFW